MNKANTLSNFIWKFLERCGAQGVSLIVTIILARLLDPAVYGIVSLITIFTSILEVFVEGGFGAALVQKKNADNLDFSSVFFFNIVLCCFLYLIMFILAPLIARFYNNTSLVPLIRVLSLILIISGVKNIQQAYVSKHMMFKKFFFATLGGTILAAIIGITLAYKGYGAWALVIQSLVNQFVDTLILWVSVKWRPEFKFSWSRFKKLYSFSWKILLTNLITNIYEKLRQLSIGKLYSISDLAYYNQGQQLPYAIVNNINTSIDSVLFPSISNVQENANSVKSMMRRAIKTSTYIMAPMMIGMAFIAEPLVKLLLSEKWLPCVFYIRVACLIQLFAPINTSNLSAIKAMGHSSIILKLEVIKRVFGIFVLLCTIWFGPKVIMLGLLGCSFFDQLCNSWPNMKLLSYSYIDQIKDIFPSIALSLAMGIIVYPVSLISLPTIWIVVLQVLLGCIIYLLGSLIFKVDSFSYVLDLIRTYFRRHT